MKETKVCVDELPKSCVGCKYFAEHRRQCELELCFQWSEEKFKFNDCPLIDIKTHDRELVKEVCDEIKIKLGSIEDILINLGNGKEDALNYFMYILNKTQKEFEK